MGHLLELSRSHSHLVTLHSQDYKSSHVALHKTNASLDSEMAHHIVADLVEVMPELVGVNRQRTGTQMELVSHG